MKLTPSINLTLLSYQPAAALVNPDAPWFTMAFPAQDGVGLCVHTNEMTPKPQWRWLHYFLGANWVVNGVWMTCAPRHWFAHMPQAPQTGPLNEHFIRDYGTVFILVGAAVLISLARDTFTRRKHLWVLAFFVAHALLHVWDMLAGRLGHDHLTSGFLLVLLPVAVLSGLSARSCWQEAAS